MIHGHPPQPPQQQPPPPHPHMGHPPPPPSGPAAHQIPPPPPHLTHLTSVPPPNVPPQQQQQQPPPPPREHHGPRINNRHQHHPRVPAGGDHHQASMAGGPHMPLHSSRKPPSQHYGAANGIGPGGGGMGSKHQHSGGMGHPSKGLPYGSNSSSSNSSHQHHHQQPHHHHQQQQHNHHSHHHSGHHNPAAIPVVSAAGPGASKARMIPSHEPKNIHNHSNTAPVGNTANAIVVHQADQVQQLSGGISSSTATTTVGGSVTTHGSTSNTSTTSANNSGSLPVVTAGSGGGGGGGGTASTTAMASPNATVVVLGSSSDSSNLKDSSTTVQSQSLLLSSVPETLANTKEKTPMCLVNELARYNKIQHQYRLTGESGPAHKKRFTVTLKLGDEEYTAEGPSIKKAQHSAANDAIGATKYKHPPAKTNRVKPGGKTNIGNITPTVELNALAMKRGEPTVYETEQVVAAPKYAVNSHPPGAPNAPLQGGGGGHNFFSAPPPHYGGYNRSNSMYNAPPPGSVRYGAPPPSSFNRRNTMGGKPDYHSRGGYYYNQHVPPMAPPIPEVYKVTLHVGERTFLGEGHTLQAARHDAAARALEVLKPLTPDSANAVSDSHNTSIDSDDPNSDLKSPISLVHEMALKRKLSVQFEVHGEKGPPHMKVFTTLCKVGSIVTEGEGNGKKLSKKRAAEKMLDELRKLPPASPEKNTRMLLKQKRKVPLPKKKTRNLIKEQCDEDPTGMVNPISRLMQIQQARKEKEPVYTLLEERGVARRREFIMEVSASGQSATGVGSTKKLAKKEAAEKLLVMLGYGRSVSAGSPNKENMSGSANEVVEKPPPAPRKSVYNEGGPEPRGGRGQHHGSAGRQIVPGVLQLNSGIANKSGTPPKEPPQENNVPNDSGSTSSNATMPSTTVNPSSTSNVTPSTAQTAPAPPATPKSTPTVDVGPMKKQLMYLAQLLKFEVLFSDFPKGNHGEYLTLVTLSTEPPQLCHGSGASLEESHDEAARGALEILSKIGLDNVKPKGSSGGTSADDSENSSDISAKLDYRVSKRIISDVLGISREENSKMKDDNRGLHKRNGKVKGLGQSKNEAHGSIKNSVVDLLMECLKDLVIDKLEHRRC